MKTPPLVEVKWEDAMTNPRWLMVDEVTYLVRTPMLCVSTGYLVARTKSVVVLCGSLNDEGTMGSLHRIPSGMVRSIKQLRGNRGFKRTKA